MAKWKEIQCPQCAEHDALWEGMERALEESDAREARLEAKLARVKASFRRNMMQAHPNYTHEQFDKDFDEMMGGQEDE